LREKGKNLPMAVQHMSRDIDPGTVVDVVCRQLRDDLARGAITRTTPDEIQRIATECVQSLWDTSRIRTFLPVLAVRHARERLQANSSPDDRIDAHSSSSVSLAALVEELGGEMSVQLSYSTADLWRATVEHRATDGASITIRVDGQGSTVNEALGAAADKARAILA
jgi:hypothetical protein